MDWWERAKIAAAIALALGTLAASTWVGGLVMAPDYPTRRAYPIEGVPPVDLARAQRTWPGGESKPGDRDIMLGYVRHIDQAKVPIAAGAVPPGPIVPSDLGALLAAADAARGKKAATVCMACHTFEVGGPNRVGPNLHGVVGRSVASHPGFAYSPALAKVGGQWSYESLDRFLSGPARAVPGTKMSFAGFRNPRDRAQIIAYLAEITPGAPPFPKPAG